MLYPLKFEPILKDKIWGGTKLKNIFNKPATSDKLGESWELSGYENDESVVSNGFLAGNNLAELIEIYMGELIGDKVYDQYGLTFPLLFKLIDANDYLSIQVHPSDELAKKRHNSMGKTEMWYVIGADKGAKLRSGFSEQITPKEYKDRVYNNTITEVLQEYDIQPGDVFFLPAGRVHSIGAGAFIAEIQQTSDVTYRIYDFDRKDSKGNARELHTDLAREAINFEVLDDYRTQYDVVENEPIELVACPYFTTSLYDMTEEITCDYSELDSFVIFVCVEGSCTLYDNEKNEVSFKAGETVLMPASTQEVTIVPNGKVKLLETYV